MIAYAHVSGLLIPVLDMRRPAGPQLAALAQLQDERAGLAQMRGVRTGFPRFEDLIVREEPPR